jgi:hypothetical protein
MTLHLNCRLIVSKRGSGWSIPSRNLSEYFEWACCDHTPADLVDCGADFRTTGPPLISRIRRPTGMVAISMPVELNHDWKSLWLTAKLNHADVIED